MLIGGIEGERHIGCGDRRQRHSPQRRHAIEAQDRLESQGHELPCGEPEDLRQAGGQDRQQDRKQIGDGQTRNGSKKDQRRILQLRISGAGHHFADVLDRRIGADAAHAIGQADPNRAVRLEPLGERAIVDQSVADGGHPAGCPQGLAPHQHAAAGRCRDAASRIVRPGEGIEHLKEEDEGGNEHALGKALAAELRHQRGQHRAAGARPRDKLAQLIRHIDDIRVGEEDVIRRLSRRLDRLHALALGPELSGPPGRQRASGNDREAVRRAERGRRVVRHLRGAVAALIVDQDHPERARIILAQQRGYRVADAFGFVTGRYDGHDRRPRPLPRRGSIVAFTAEPKEAAPQEEIQPDRQHH